MAAMAAALTAAGELVIVYAGFHGFLALAASGIPALAGWGTFAGALWRAGRVRSPAPAALA
jgi:hypothetical protein